MSTFGKDTFEQHIWWRVWTSRYQQNIYQKLTF